MVFDIARAAKGLVVGPGETVLSTALRVTRTNDPVSPTSSNHSCCLPDGQSIVGCIFHIEKPSWPYPIFSVLSVLLLVITSVWAFSPPAISWYYSEQSNQIKLRNGRKLKLPEVCKSLATQCSLSPVLFNGHLQTIWALLEPQSNPTYYLRRLFVQEDKAQEGVFAVDFVTDAFEEDGSEIAPGTMYCTDDAFQSMPSDDSHPMVVILHGLCGGSHELYLRHVLAPLLSREEKWEACVLISRGCAGTPIRGGGIYHARLTCDLRQTIGWLQRTFPNRPLFAVGFSMGASILTRYIAEEGQSCALRAAVVVSNPWNLEVCALHMQRTLFGRLIYSPFMAFNLMKIFWRNASAIASVAEIDMRKAKQIKYIHEFDRYIQCPSWKFRTETEYYRQSSSSNSVLDVAVPFLAINANDDPITGSEGIPRQEFLQSKYAVLCTTSQGGHLGWVQNNGKRWYASLVTGFLSEMYYLDTGGSSG